MRFLKKKKNLLKKEVNLLCTHLTLGSYEKL